jgi:anti-anti-sigma regulatory factor
MLSVGIDHIGDMTIFSYKGNIIGSEPAFALRKAVTSETYARIIVFDLTEVYAIEGDGLDMFSGLKRWALDQNIQFKLFNPSYSVRNELENNESLRFDIALFEEIMALLTHAESYLPKAA